MKINLFYLSTSSYGGHVTYTVHLARGLRAAGHEVTLYKCGNRTEAFARNFGYDEKYQNLSLEDASKLCKNEACLITATNKPLAEKIDQLVEAGARAVIHDPAEFKRGWNWRMVQRPILIRKSMLEHVKNGVFFPHPYDRHYPRNEISTGKKSALSISRIDFDKHTEILLDANRLLAKKKKIDIYGFENRIYTRFNIVPKYPEWEQSVAKYPKELRYATELCHDYTFMCDMSEIKGDGGGTQYTFLEAIDAGCCCVLNEDWILKGHVMKDGVNCLTVGNGRELAKLIKDKPRIEDKVEEVTVGAKKLLGKHDAKKIGKLYAEELS